MPVAEVAPGRRSIPMGKKSRTREVIQDGWFVAAVFVGQEEASIVRVESQPNRVPIIISMYFGDQPIP
jgi:hypothetical protein